MEPHNSSATRSASHLRRPQSAFTLVELLVVIGIIALLISILLPSLNRARRAAAAIQCSSNMRQIAMAMLQYTADNKGKLIPLRVSGTTTYWPKGFFWANELVRGKYIIGPNSLKVPASPDYFQSSIFRCPEASPDMILALGAIGTASQEPLYPADAKNNAGFIDNVALTPDTGLLDFGISTWYQPVGGSVSASSAWPPVSAVSAQRATPFLWYSGTAGDGYLADPHYSRKLSQIRRSSEVIMLAEANQPNWIKKGTAPHLLNRLAARHGNKTGDKTNAYTNFAFFDGHVAAYETLPFDTAYVDGFNNGTVFFFNNVLQ
ncbi:MAG: hypothetical protein JWM57_3466 [Phycisphaerales bacterium]|nr:hypothetical protein [Phycisphaerales bacterium]